MQNAKAELAIATRKSEFVTTFFCSENMLCRAFAGGQSENFLHVYDVS